MTTNIPAAEPESEWTTRQADQLHVGDHIAGDMLPLGQPGEVIFTRFFADRRSEWMFVAFVQWDGFHDSTTFLASAPVRVRTAQPQQVADPTGLAYTRADDEPDDPTPVSGHRVPPHTGAMTDEGLVDETAAECSQACKDAFWPGSGNHFLSCPGSPVKTEPVYPDAP